jgi:uncharacterized repeat protein (TIGR01451 family)
MLRIGMKIGVVVLGSLTLALTLNLGLAMLQGHAQTNQFVFYVAPGGQCAPGTAVIPNCYADVQTAVDMATSSIEIRVAAGVYTDVNGYGGLAQVVYISKTVMVRGGYTITNWMTPNPVANPTVLDARGLGRVLYIVGNVSPTVAGMRITNGSAEGLGGYPGFDAGGGVYVRDASATLENLVIVDNVAEYGGGVYLQNSAATLRGNQISSNTEGVSGGGVYLYHSPARLIGNIVARNMAEYGGGCYVNATSGGQPVIQGNRFVDNWGQLNGGGLYLLGPATLERNVLVDNNRAHRGGGMYLDHSAAMMNANIIRDNYAGADGGGLYLYKNSDAALHNNVIADNVAGSSGNGLYIEGASPHLVHTTIANNGAGGQGMYVTEYTQDGYIEYSSPTLTNTIMVGHGVGIDVHAGNTVTLESTLWHNNGSDWGGAGEIQQQHAYTGDPAFVAPSAGDYHIGVTSAALDIGVAAGVDRDLDGDPRPSGDGYDVGADEYAVLSVQVTKQAYPTLVNPGEQLTYTLRVVNTSNVDLHLTITDTLPLHITQARNSRGSVSLPGGTFVWSPVLLVRGAVWTETLVVTVALDYAGSLINTVDVTSLEGAKGSDTAVSQVGPYTIYLPLVVRRFDSG